jgi:hypothetical protein
MPVIDLRKTRATIVVTTSASANVTASSVMNSTSLLLP